MDEEQARRAVDEINAHLLQMPWLDFEVMEYRGETLVVRGSLDTSTSHDVEIKFKGVFFVSLPVEWKTDTRRPPLAVMMAEEAAALNRRFQVEQGNHIFQFTPEDYPQEFGCLICAREISFDVVKPRSAMAKSVGDEPREQPRAAVFPGLEPRR